MELKELLKDYDSGKVDIYINYISELGKETNKDNKIVNYWVKDTTPTQFAAAFKKVSETGLFIDGETVTLTFRKKLIITYDYHAYENKVKLVYPESKFDFGVVYEGDTFSYKKENGKVIYSYIPGDIFKVKKNIIGAYGVIKNNAGEFIETINVDDITKMKNTSKMAFIWNSWLDRMVLKSVIKRICSIHFKSIVVDIDKQDNEYNEPERASIDENILLAIDDTDTLDQLEKVYHANISNVVDKTQFIKVINSKKKELS